MTITFNVSGTQSGATAPVTAVAPTLPSGILGGDITFLTVAAKPYNATITTPTGWTKVGEWTNGSTAPGSETGSVKLAVYYQIGSQTAGVMPYIGQTSASSMVANTATYSTSGGSWDVSVSTVASINADTTAYSVIGGSIPLATNDTLLGLTALDAAGGSRSAASFITTGVTQANAQGRVGATCTTGFHSALYWRDVQISAGTASVAPVFSFTNTSALSGATLFLRLRDGGTGLVATAAETVGITDAVTTGRGLQASVAETIGVVDLPGQQVLDDSEVVGELVGVSDAVTASLATANPSTPVVVTATRTVAGSATVVVGSTAVTAALTAAGTRSSVSATTATPVVAGLTAAGVVVVILSSAATAPVVVATQVAAGTVPRTSASTATPVTASRTAAGVAASRSDSYDILVTAVLTAAGTVAVPGIAAVPIPVTAAVTALLTGGYPTASTATAVAAARPATGAVQQSGASTTTAVTSAMAAIAGRSTQSPAPSTPVTAAVTAQLAWGSGAGQSTALTVAAARIATGSTANPGGSALAVVAAGTAAGSARKASTAILAVTATATADTSTGGRVSPSTALAVTATCTAAAVVGRRSASQLFVVSVLATSDSRAQFQSAAVLPVRAVLRGTGSVQRLPSSLVTDLWYQSLPAVYRAVDAQDTTSASSRPLYWFLDAMTSQLGVPMRIATRIRDGELTDASVADDEWIPWLAQAIGVSGVSVAELRARLLALQAAPALASTAYLVALIKPMLTATQSVLVYPNPPWTITVVVNAGELGNVGGTTDGLAAALYATGRVPTGYLLSVTSAAVETWAQIDAVTSTWADVAGDSWKTVDTAGL